MALANLGRGRPKHAAEVSPLDIPAASGGSERPAKVTWLTTWDAATGGTTTEVRATYATQLPVGNRPLGISYPVLETPLPAAAAPAVPVQAPAEEIARKLEQDPWGFFWDPVQPSTIPHSRPPSPVPDPVRERLLAETIAREMMAGPRGEELALQFTTAIVVKFNQQEGYGFIREEATGDDYFYNRVHLDVEGLPQRLHTLYPGEKVQFLPEAGSRGLFAVGVTRMPTPREAAQWQQEIEWEEHQSRRQTQTLSVFNSCNRTPMTCPVCYVIHKYLSVHLRRKCMRLCSDEEIKASMASAKKTLTNIASKGTAIDYEKVMSLGSLENVVPFLEDRGFLIFNKPTVARNIQHERPSTSAAIAVPQYSAAAQVQVIEKDIAGYSVEPEQEMEVTLVPVEPMSQTEDTPTFIDASIPQDDGDSSERNPEQVAETEETPPLTDPSIAQDDGGSGDTIFVPRSPSEDAPNDDSDENLDKRTQRLVPYLVSVVKCSGLTYCAFFPNDRILQMNWTGDAKKKMKEAGLYRQHSLEDPMIKGFASYLQHTLGVTNYRQEVENVARFLYYMNPQRANLEFVKDIEKANFFFTKLRELSLENQTVFNYLKNIRRFMTYQMRGTNLSAQRLQLFQSCNFFMGVTEDIQKRLSKGVSREVVSKRYLALTTSMKTPAECRRLLVMAKPPFLKGIRATQGKSLNQDTKLQIIYYLQALLVLKHLQQPGVVQNMTVSEWKERIHYRYLWEDLVIIGVKLHKIALPQVASFVLTKEEEMWFNTYYERVRPTLVHKDSPKDIFFLSTSGQEIHSVSNDIARLHKKYQLPNVTSQLVRRVCETWTLPKYSDSEKCLFSKYLAHSNLTAERNYREKTLEDICHGYKLVIEAGHPGSNKPQASTSRNEDTWVGGNAE
ncbi:uncharacterized protein ACNLHF_015557 [Anomaloglossus baeobatrachus]